MEINLIPENSRYKVDASGRIIIPSHIRNRFNITLGDYVEYYTALVDGEWFLCAKKSKVKEEEKKK